MTKLDVLKKTKVGVADILGEAKKIPTDNAHTCDWIDEQWVSPEEYQQWAEISFRGGDDRGFVSAVVDAKRAACRVLDTLILKYHQEYAKRCGYPEKIDALRKIGINVDSFVTELIIDPGNDLGHEYRVPESEDAARAIQVAGLFVAAMRQDFDRKPIVAFGWNLLGGARHLQEAGDVVEFNGLAANPMFFIDVFGRPPEIKILDPQASEVRFAPLKAFSKQDCVDLGVYLRSHYAHANRDASEMAKTTCEALISQAGL
jgi:hypothetical protein